MKPGLIFLGALSLRALDLNAAPPEKSPPGSEQPAPATSSASPVASVSPAPKSPIPAEPPAASSPITAQSPARSTTPLPAASPSPTPATTPVTPRPVAPPSSALFAPTRSPAPASLEFSKPAPLAVGALSMSPASSAPRTLISAPATRPPAVTADFLSSRESKSVAAASRADTATGKPAARTDAFDTASDSNHLASPKSFLELLLGEGDASQGGSSTSPNALPVLIQTTSDPH